MTDSAHDHISIAVKRGLARIAKSYRLSALYAFGSREREVAEAIRQKFDSLTKSNADLDIAVLPGSGVELSAREKIEIILELENLFGAKRADLVILTEADPFLAVNAIRGERIYCEDQHRADEYELYVLRRGGDLIPLERQRIRMILGEEK